MDLNHYRNQLKWREYLAVIFMETVEDNLKPYKRGEVWLKSRMNEYQLEMYYSYLHIKALYINYNLDFRD